MEQAANILLAGLNIFAPLAVALLCLYARRRRIGGDDLLLWAAAHIALALALLMANVASSRGEVAQLGLAWQAGLAFHAGAAWLLLFGVLAVDDRRVTAALGLSVSGAIAALVAGIVFLAPGFYLDVGLLVIPAVVLATAAILILRRRSVVYVIAGLVMLLRGVNNVFLALEIQQAGAFLLPQHVASLSVFLNFLTGISLLAIAVENAWLRLGAALAEARDARQEADTVLDLAPVSIVRKDGDLRLVKVNRYFEELAERIGADAGPLIGTRREEVLPRDAVLQMEALDRQVLARPDLGPVEREVSFRAANGSEVTMLVRKSATAGEDGSPTGVISVALDITRLKEAERELRRQIMIAEQASRIKSDFLAHMSHELRTPLNGIGGYAEMLSAGYIGPLSAKQAEYVGNIQESSRHMLELISRILDLSQLDTGKMRLERTALDLTAVMREVVAELADQASARQVKIELAGESVGAEADRAAMHKVFSNLLSNAIAFGPQGGSVRVALRREEGRAIVTVSDCGPGMTAQQISALGDLFLRSDPKKARAGGGSGLGLAISRSLVDLHGGRLTIASGASGGTTVTVTL